MGMRIKYENYLFEWVSEWVFNTKWLIFLPYRGKNKLHFDEKMSIYLY